MIGQAGSIGGGGFKVFEISVPGSQWSEIPAGHPVAYQVEARLTITNKNGKTISFRSFPFVLMFTSALNYRGSFNQVDEDGDASYGVIASVICDVSYNSLIVWGLCWNCSLDSITEVKFKTLVE